MARPFAALGVITSIVALGGACGGASTNDAAPSPAPGTTIDAGTAPSSGGLPCNVDAILAKNCRTCHSDPPQYGAYWPLVTWDDLHAHGPLDGAKSIYEKIPARIASDTAPMPPPPNARLSAVDQKVLTDWAAAGAPRGPDTCASQVPIEPAPVSCGAGKKVSLAAATPWTMPTDVGDQYVCWGVDLAENPAQHITSFSPRIDNKTIVHHVVLYEAGRSYSTTPTPCSSGASLSWRMVFGWAPGTLGLELPPDVGFPIGTTSPTHYVMVVHYSNARKLTGQVDSSGIDLCTAPPRTHEADVLAFGTQTIHIPPQPPPGGVFSLDCSLTVPSLFAGLHLIAAMPHMHKLGVKMSTTLTPKAGGADVDLGTLPAYSFESQAWLPVNATTAAGDVIHTKCGWTNNTGVEVNFGEKTADEMCYSFTMYYPRIRSPAWSWALPSTSPPFGSTCQ